MNDQQDKKMWIFRKEQNGKELFCRVQFFPDGSVFVEGDETEIIFEKSPDALQEAMAHLEKLGYTRITR